MSRVFRNRTVARS